MDVTWRKVNCEGSISLAVKLSAIYESLLLGFVNPTRDVELLNILLRTFWMQTRVGVLWIRSKAIIIRVLFQQVQWWVRYCYTWKCLITDQEQRIEEVKRFSDVFPRRIPRILTADVRFFTITEGRRPLVVLQLPSSAESLHLPLGKHITKFQTLRIYERPLITRPMGTQSVIPSDHYSRPGVPSLITGVDYDLVPSRSVP